MRALLLISLLSCAGMALTEAWAQRCPAIVNRRCAVFEGQARRSGGAVPVAGFAELEAAIDLVTSDEQLRDQLGAAGRRYVEERYHWDVVLDETLTIALSADTSETVRYRVLLDAPYLAMDELRGEFSRDTTLRFRVDRSALVGIERRADQGRRGTLSLGRLRGLSSAANRAAGARPRLAEGDRAGRPGRAEPARHGSAEAIDPARRTGNEDDC